MALPTLAQAIQAIQNRVFVNPILTIPQQNT
jgi:hypothetical protein